MRALRLSCLVLLFVAVAVAAPKRGAVGTVSTFLPHLSGGAGVSGDGQPYEHGVGGVQSYLGAGGKNVNLVTYSTGRRLTLQFDAVAPAHGLSGLPAQLQSEVTLFGVNYYGPYLSMGIGTTAQVQADLEFVHGRETYELDYASLAAKRLSADTWLLTSDPLDVGGDPGFTASPVASLRVIRRKSQHTYGTVEMPIRFQVRLQ